MFLWKHSFDTSGTTTKAKQQRFFNVVGKVVAVERYRVHSERVEIGRFRRGYSFNIHQSGSVLWCASPLIALQVFAHAFQTRKA